MKISFKDFQELCRRNLDRNYIREILDTSTNSDCLFSPGIIMPKDHIANIYEFRLKNAKEKDKHSKDFLHDFEETVLELHKSHSDSIGITALYDNQYLYMVFYEPETKYVLGALKASNPSTLKEMEQNYADTISKGYSVSTQKYSNGQLTKEWK